MKFTVYEETYINPATGYLVRRFKGHPVVILDQKKGEVFINLNDLPARATSGEIVDIINRALNDFNLPGTLQYKGSGQFVLNWIKLWNWKTFVKGELVVYLNENCGPDPTAVAMGIKKESSNSYEDEPVPVVLTREDWTEIYYAIESKQLHIAEYNQVKSEQKRWAAHLQDIMDKIGPDGDVAAASGVEANN